MNFYCSYNVYSQKRSSKYQTAQAKKEEMLQDVINI